jgi:hypothetical protein
MALRVARGLFRLWLVLSALWIGVVGFVTGQTFPVMPEWATLSSICDVPANERSEDWDCSWLARVKDRLDLDKEQRAALQSAILLALLPPAFMLAVGSALVWAIRGFRQP